jgi:tetratricopeptide (TPR) repeat protein
MIDQRMFTESVQLFEQGVTLFSQKAYDEAISLFDMALQINPNLAEAYYKRGNCHSQKGNYREAVNDYTKAIELTAMYTKASNNSRLTFKDQNVIERAAADGMKAIELRPNLSDTLFNRGLAYLKSWHAEDQKAFADFSRVIALDDRNIRAYFHRGQSALALGFTEIAIADFSKVITADSSFRNGYCERGLEYITQGSFDLGMKDFQKVIELVLEEPLGYLIRGVMYLDKELWPIDSAQQMLMGPLVSSL